MRPSKKFNHLLSFYLKAEGSRIKKYEQAEQQYQAETGEMLYNDFRIFEARLTHTYNEKVPHQHNLTTHIKQKL